MVSEYWDKGAAGGAPPVTLPGGAALVGALDSAVGWVLIDDGSARRLGPALAWARRSGVGELHVLVEGAEVGVVARRASLFDPAPAVWGIVGRSLVAAVPAGWPAPGGGARGDLADLLARHGCEVLVEQGVLRGDVLGLEVAREIDGRLEVGVGRYDRWARTEMRAGWDADAAVAEAVLAVRMWRRPGAAAHPANTLQRSRWLRSLLCASPEVVGAEWLAPVAPTLSGSDLTEDVAAPCAGPGVVAVCSVGIDLDLVPAAADSRAGADPSARLVLVLPQGDDVAITRQLAASLASPASVLTVPRSWAEGLLVGDPFGF